MTPMALIRGEPIGMQLRYAAAMIFVSWIRILLINVVSMPLLTNFYQLEVLNGLSANKPSDA